MDKRQAGTNAADSAPGVDDGPATGRAPDHRLGPGGRRVWLGVAAILALLAVIFLARPITDRTDQGATGRLPPASPIQSGQIPQAPAPQPPG